MSDKYQPLRDAIAAGPTKGPWLTTAPDEIEGQFFVVTMSRDGDERRIVCKINNFISGRPLEDEDIASAAYIAAADPDTIAALLRERDALQSKAVEHQDGRLRALEQLAVARARNERLREALRLADAAMNHMGDALNAMDACLPEDEAAVAAAFEAVSAALADGEEE